MQETLNDVTTYEDAYGNTKMLSVEDHSSSQSFSCNKPMDKKELVNLAILLKEADKDYLNSVKTCKQHLFPKLLNNNIWAGIILYDDVKDAFSWDSKKFNNFITNKDMVWTLARFINKITEEDVVN